MRETMAIKWIKVENVKGLRYYEHSTRIYKKRKDKNFSLTYKLDGQTKTEALGWESDGWTIEKASAIMNDLRQNQKTGQGARTLAAKREAAKRESEKEENEQKKKVTEERTFHDLFSLYIERAKIDESKKTYETKKGIYRKRIPDSIKGKTLSEINIQDIEVIKLSMIGEGMAPNYIEKTFNVITQVFKFAINMYGYNGEIPTSKIKVTRKDNKRDRFLTEKEANLLLEELLSISEQLHDMALLSLYCGLRAGEIFKLKWSHINFDNNRVLLRDRKNGQNIQLPMHSKVKEMLTRNTPSIENVCDEYIFKTINNEQKKQISASFRKAVEKLGFNKGVTDPRHKVVFHTLRHTYASRLVMKGVDLYTTQILMGHKNSTMTQRYAHLAPEHLDKAVSVLN
jgi:integrase